MSNLGQIHFSIEQVTKLLAMQDQLNSYIHPEWKSQNFDWNFAIIDECREIKEHLGWKWWKENYQCGLTEANRKQVQLEVIDILHFVLSKDLEHPWGIDVVTACLNDSTHIQMYEFATLDNYVSEVMEQAITDGMYYSEYWNKLAVAVELTTEQVIETYTQKFVLNKFRQDHGYKDGTYIKHWHVSPPVYGDNTEVVLEDNEVLERIVSSGMPVDEDLLYGALKSAYERAAELRKHS